MYGDPMLTDYFAIYTMLYILNKYNDICQLYIDLKKNSRIHKQVEQDKIHV